MEERFPHLRFRVLADHLYNGRSVLHAVLSHVDNDHLVTRDRPDAVASVATNERAIQEDHACPPSYRDPRGLRASEPTQ